VTENVTFTAVLEDEPVILHGEAGTSYANYENYALIPKTTSVTADLTGEADGYLLWAFDHAGTGFYESNCDGSITVLAPEGCILQVAADVNTEGGCDFLYVYDGDSTSAEQLGSYSGSTSIGKLYSTGSAVTVRFTSDGGVNRRGVDVKITVTAPSSLVTVSFDAGDGEGTMDDIVLLPGDQTYIPYNAFTVPDGYLFDCYTDGTKKYNEHDLITVTEDLHLTAVYVEKITINYVYGDQTYTTIYKKGTRYSVRTFSGAGFTLPYRKSFKCWMLGDEEVAAQTWLTATEDLTYTPVFNDLPILIEDGEGGYYANLPKDVDASLDLSDRSNGFTFNIYDDGGKNGYYSDNCDGSLTITAPEGCVFRISGLIRSESYTDYLSIYEADMTTLFDSSTVSTDSTTAIAETFSSGNVIKVYFHSNDYYYTTGFELTVTLIDPSTLITVSFDAGEASGEMAPMTQIAGVPFRLPDYGFTAPEGKIFSGYTDGENVWWPVTVTFNESKTLTALWAAATGITYSCCGADEAIRYPKGEAITVPDYTDIFAPVSGMHFVGWQEEFSGEMYLPGDTYVPNDPTVFTAVFEILTDDGNGGLYATMPVNNVNDPLTIDLSDKPSGFTFTLYDDGGADGNYADYNDAVITIKAPENMVVKVSGSGRTENSWDYLYFYNGPTTSNIINNTRYTGGFSISPDMPIMTDGNYLTLYFHSDSSS
ncbi:MAG: hypothetical protein IJQ80_08225, partial [Clostridia bacterium]|nr:hypothetical protein [Clostridia bacterium]